MSNKKPSPEELRRRGIDEATEVVLYYKEWYESLEKDDETVSAILQDILKDIERVRGGEDLFVRPWTDLKKALDRHREG